MDGEIHELEWSGDLKEGGDGGGASVVVVEIWDSSSRQASRRYVKISKIYCSDRVSMGASIWGGACEIAFNSASSLAGYAQGVRKKSIILKVPFEGRDSVWV